MMLGNRCRNGKASPANAARRRLLIAGALGGWLPDLVAAQAAERAERWVVLDPTLVEIVVALQGQDRLAGVVGGTEHLVLPGHVQRLEGYRIVAAEPILALRPSRVLIGSERIIPQTIAQLRAAGVSVERLGAEATVPGLHARVREVARLLGRPQAAARIEREFDFALQAAQAEAAAAASRPRAVFILAGGARPTVAGGRGTYPDTLLALSGATNIASAIEGYKVLSQEVMLTAAPEVILTIEEGLQAGSDGVPAVLRAPGARFTPAARNNRVITLPGRYLQGMGLDTPEAVRMLSRALHPELK